MTSSIVTTPSTGAVPEGMREWHGGYSAPADWDGGLVLWDSGTCDAFNTPNRGDDYSWTITSPGPNIIAYTPKPTPAPVPATREGWRGPLKTLVSFVSVMTGHGPDCIVPEEVRTPLGIPVKLGAIIREANAALASPTAPQSDAGDGWRTDMRRKVTPGDVMLFAEEAFRNMDVELDFDSIGAMQIAMQTTFDRLSAPKAESSERLK